MIVALASCAYRRAEIPRSPAPTWVALTCFDSCRSREDMAGVRCVMHCPGAVRSEQACSDSNRLCVHDKYLPTAGIVFSVLGGLLGLGVIEMLRGLTSTVRPGGS